MADYVLDMLMHGVFVDPLSVVLAMRQQRYHTVHTKIQLLFLYDFLTCNAMHERNQLLVSTLPPTLALSGPPDPSPAPALATPSPLTSARDAEVQAALTQRDAQPPPAPS